MTGADIDRTAIAFVRPYNGVIAHGFVLVIGRFIDGSKDMDGITGAFIELIPFIGDIHPGGQVAGGGMAAILDYKASRAG